MYFPFNFAPPLWSRLLPLRPLLLAAALAAIALIVAGAQPGHATTAQTQLGTELTAGEGDAPPRAYAGYFIQLQDEPAASFYAALAAGEQAQVATANALTQAHLATIEQAQMQLVATLASHDAYLLYRVQRVLNGVAVHAPTDQVAAMAALPGVEGVYPLIPKEPDNARANALLNAPAIWEGITRAGLTGEGVSIAIIDTGIDYLHTMFGGPGLIDQVNDTTIIGDVPNFPGAKIAGGYDFAGDDYDASPTSINYQPVPEPDPDPMDCYGSFGHGTHVAGTAAGYGVRTDGATYAGPYDSSINWGALRIGPGLAPQATIYALKVFGCSGSSNVVDAAIEWAVDPNQDGDFSDHMDVMNLSLGSNFGGSFDATTVAVENAAKVGIIVVASAGNTGDVHYAVGSPGIATRAIAVAATSIDNVVSGNLSDGIIASFSARGPRRGDNALKPDLVAPGVNIISARRDSGSQSATSSGTSMASPVVAGTMALLRQAYPESGAPGWSSQELKALAMNTAAYPLLRPDVTAPYSLLRVGAGRIDPTSALQSHLIAYDAAAPDRVSVSFGAVDVLDRTTTQRFVRLANKSALPIAVAIAYTSVSDLPGVTVDVGAGSVITIPALSFATTPITLTADAAAMSRRPDPARQAVPNNAYPWLDETSGYISFTPVITTNGPSIHLPIHALPRVVSALTALSEPLDLDDAITATFPLTIAGSAITTAIAPSQTVPLFGVFSLAHSSPPLPKVLDDELVLGRFAQADLRYIGTLGPVMVQGERMLYFALVSYGPWSTPLDVTFEIAMDTNEDSLIDYRLQNREATDTSALDFATTDDFVTILERAGGARFVQGILNFYPPTQYDTRPFDNNVMVMGVRLDDLGANVRTIRYQVTSTSRDLTDTPEVDTIDRTPVLSLRLDAGAGVVTEKDVPLFPVAAGDVIPVTFDRTAYLHQNSQGLLLIYPHNEAATRSQTNRLQVEWPYQQYMPRIFAKQEMKNRR